MPTFYDKFGKEVDLGDVENRAAWYEHGLRKEEVFVDRHWNLGYRINPDKEVDPTVIDFVKDGGVADLKTQNTPFFSSRRYQVDPQYAVTFNKKDLARYTENYPQADIIFWVDWQIVRADFGGWTSEVLPMYGVWLIPLPSLAQLCDDSRNLHSYQRRIGDRGNANESYVLDLKNQGFRRLA